MTVTQARRAAAGPDKPSLTWLNYALALILLIFWLGSSLTFLSRPPQFWVSISCAATMLLSAFALIWVAGPILGDSRFWASLVPPIRGTVALATLIATIAAVLPPRNPAEGNLEARQPITIQSLFANRCVDVQGPLTDNGTPIQLWDCINVPEERWYLEPDGHIRGFGGKCLAVADPQNYPPDGTPVELQDCRPELGQRWHQEDGHLIADDGKCLDVRGPLKENGTVLQVWTCQDVPQHLWRIF